jgi:hypothetical protein
VPVRILTAKRPSLLGRNLITRGWVIDNQPSDEQSGAVRACLDSLLDQLMREAACPRQGQS